MLPRPQQIVPRLYQIVTYLYHTMIYDVISNSCPGCLEPNWHLPVPNLYLRRYKQLPKLFCPNCVLAGPDGKRIQPDKFATGHDCDENKTVFIKNLAYETDEEDLRFAPILIDLDFSKLAAFDRHGDK